MFSGLGNILRTKHAFNCKYNCIWCLWYLSTTLIQNITSLFILQRNRFDSGSFVVIYFCWSFSLGIPLLSITSHSSFAHPFSICVTCILSLLPPQKPFHSFCLLSLLKNNKCVCMVYLHEYRPHRGQTRSSNSLDQGLQTVMCHCMGARNQIWILWENIQCP